MVCKSGGGASRSASCWAGITCAASDSVSRLTLEGPSAADEIGRSVVERQRYRKLHVPIIPRRRRVDGVDGSSSGRPKDDRDFLLRPAGGPLGAAWGVSGAREPSSPSTPPGAFPGHGSAAKDARAAASCSWLRASRPPSPPCLSSAPTSDGRPAGASHGRRPARADDLRPRSRKRAEVEPPIPAVVVARSGAGEGARLYRTVVHGHRRSSSFGHELAPRGEAVLGVAVIPSRVRASASARPSPWRRLLDAQRTHRLFVRHVPRLLPGRELRGAHRVGTAKYFRPLTRLRGRVFPHQGTLLSVVDANSLSSPLHDRVRGRDHVRVLQGGKPRHVCGRRTYTTTRSARSRYARPARISSYPLR